MVDNSGSMADEQDRLATSFDGFITSIQNTVMAEDHHIVVIDAMLGKSGRRRSAGSCTESVRAATAQRSTMPRPATAPQHPLDP